MITTPTVFVLGAGASAPFGFPTGMQLVQRIHQDSGVHARIREVGFREEVVQEFHNELWYSGESSIDAFLEAPGPFGEIGKVAIATCLIQCENLGALFSPWLGNGASEQNWMRYLMSRMRAPLENFGENRVTFITFNYDRSLEAFMFRMLKSKFHAGDEDVSQQLKRIPVIHVHGQIGFLPWQKGFDQQNVRDYEPRLSPELVKNAADGINIIHDDFDLTPFSDAVAALQNAQRAYFLGFGYHETNMKRLQIQEIASQRPDLQIAGSFHGFTQAERRHMCRLTEGRVISSSKDPSQQRICEFLRNRKEFQND